MDWSKYIVVEMPDGLVEARLFPAYQNHSDHTRGDKVLGAGFFALGCYEGNVSISAFGKSVTLKIESRGDEDARAIEQLLRVGQFGL